MPIKSKYDYYSDQELQTIVDESESIRDVIIKVGLSPNGQGGYVTFHKKIKERGIDISKLRERTHNKLSKINISKRIPLDEILKDNSSYPRVHLKKRLLSTGLLKNKCLICGQPPMWRGKPLSLHLDHINGVNNDNRIENLRMLCPHCHSQQKTTSKNKEELYYDCHYKGSKSKYCKCGSPISRNANSCLACSHENRLKFKVSKEKLERLIQQHSFVKIGEMFGVSDNAIRKRAKKLHLI